MGGREQERHPRTIQEARQAFPCILFFDEIDAIAPVRGTRGSDSHVTERVISQLLTELDGIEGLKDVVVLAATNRLDIMDPAVLRPGRFDYLIELPVPDIKTRETIFEVHLKDKPLAKNVNIKELTRKAEGLVGADIEAICRMAAMLAIRKMVESYGGEKFDLK